MSNAIQKLNKLKNPESFIQINTVEGFQYIDKAGEIVNKYHSKDAAPIFSMDLNGLVIKTPRDKIYELKITPQIVWMKFNEIDSLDMIAKLFNTESKLILDILNINKINRIGWRNYFIFEFDNQENQKKYFQNLTKFENGSLSIAKFEIDTKKNFKINLMIQSVVKNDENKTPGVLFDVDIFQTGKIDIDDISKMLNSFKDYLKNKDDFLSILNDTFIQAK
ncbi:MAG: hypothetical protein HQ530_05350 [Parcubacteria group bacterium]|nr:hypothetical protein [Parcubacteria group bacterium]